ncbi:hypothetical protein IAU60_004496 [Kwoniella sp. DSM 27419]
MTALRQSFASSSRLTLHHLPLPTLSRPVTPYAYLHLRSLSSLAQPTAQPAGFEGIPSAAYSGPVKAASESAKAKGKEPHAAPQPATKLDAAPKKAGERRRPELRGKKNCITMTPAAISRLEQLVASPTEPKLLRISVKSRGCAGMAYHLDYVPPPGGKFDEVVEQDGVKVLIDSKALFSIIGSRMDWRDNRLSAGFVFDNPNVVDTCGCGESFNIRV